MQQSLGFIGLGVMGEPMCRNLARRSGARVLGYDKRPDPLVSLGREGVQAAESVCAVATHADVIFLSLPGGPELETVMRGDGGLLSSLRAGQTVIDTSTAPVALTRELASACAQHGVDYADAPIARTRAAAEAGTLSVMVGASQAVFERIRPLLECFAEEITHCGAVGAGQVVKLMNNMVLFQTVVALAEARTVGERAGVDPSVLFDTLAKGSADSFALRNHGMKSLLPREFPERAFSTEYAAKDLAYALELARNNGLTLAGAETAAKVLRETAALGFAGRYFPALLHVVDK